MKNAHCQIVGQSVAKWCVVVDVIKKIIAKGNAKLPHGQSIKNGVMRLLRISLQNRKCELFVEKKRQHDVVIQDWQI